MLLSPCPSCCGGHARPGAAARRAGCAPRPGRSCRVLRRRAAGRASTSDHVPGAVVSVVVRRRRRCSPRATAWPTSQRGADSTPTGSLVRIASITKLFTWTAVMQQVEAGRLDLDADVNRYLTDFQIPATLPAAGDAAAPDEPHRRVRGPGHRHRRPHRRPTCRRSASYLADNMPARIRPPGEISAYSNYGAALAGHIVAQVSGEPYDRYVRRHLLDPLGMTHSTADRAGAGGARRRPRPQLRLRRRPAGGRSRSRSTGWRRTARSAPPPTTWPGS